MLIPSFALFLFASGIENGAGTGWTINGRSFFARECKVIKLFSMRRLIQVLYFMIHVARYTCRILSCVKILAARIKYAWVHTFTSSTHQRLNKENLNNERDIFENWLVGVTDGDGTFNIYNKDNKWNLAFKIDQSRYNLRLLFFIKKKLGVGKVKQSGDNASFVIRDRKILKKHVLPIFDKYPLLTSKYFNYLKFREVDDILENSNLNALEKNKNLLEIKERIIPSDYLSPVWYQNSSNKINLSKNIINKPWLIGFVEAEGSFYIVKKDEDRLVHGFGLTQKLDFIVLRSISSILKIPSKVQYKNNYYSLDTTNSRAIENIISYFNGTMKGMKSFEYRVWARSYNKYKSDYEKLYRIREILRKTKKNLLNINLFK